MYVLSQLLGSTLACLTLRVLFNDQNNFDPIATQYSTATTDLEAITWEFIITFILMFIICGVSSDHRAVRLFFLSFFVEKFELEDTNFELQLILTDQRALRNCSRSYRLV